MCLDCGKKLKHPEEIPTNRGEIYKCTGIVYGRNRTQNNNTQSKPAIHVSNIYSILLLCSTFRSLADRRY